MLKSSYDQQIGCNYDMYLFKTNWLAVITKLNWFYFLIVNFKIKKSIYN